MASPWKKVNRPVQNSNLDDIMNNQASEKLRDEIELENDRNDEILQMALAMSLQENNTKKKQATNEPEEDPPNVTETQHSEITDEDFALALQLEEEELLSARIQQRAYDEKRHQQLVDIKKQSSNSKLQFIIDDAPETYDTEYTLPERVRQLPEVITKHNPIIDSEKASRLLQEFDGVGNLENSGNIYNQGVVGKFKNHLHHLQNRKK